MQYFSSVQSLSRVRLFVTPWIAARQASLSITNSWSSLRLTSIKSVMPSSHLILCRPLLLLPPIPPSIRGFSNESTLRIRWPKYWSFSFAIIPSKEHPGPISFRMDWLDLLAIQGTLKSQVVLGDINQKIYADPSQDNKKKASLYANNFWNTQFIILVFQEQTPNVVSFLNMACHQVPEVFFFLFFSSFFFSLPSSLPPFLSSSSSFFLFSFFFFFASSCFL